MKLFAEFVTSAAQPAQFAADGLPEFALVGRSNVGKSSLINTLLGERKLARTSSTPGATQVLNFYRVWPEGRPRIGDPKAPAEAGGDRWLTGAAREAAHRTHAFYLVDMPGYGYARVSQAERQAWALLIEGYLAQRRELAAVMQIVDLRHPPTDDDTRMWAWLRHHGLPRIAVATKADKVPASKRPAHLKEVIARLGLTGPDPGRPGAAPGPAPGAASGTGLAEEAVVVFSAEDRTGREHLWRWLLAARAAAQREGDGRGITPRL